MTKHIEAARTEIMNEIYANFATSVDYFPVTQFEIAQQDKIKALDSLVADGTLRNENGKYVFTLPSYVQSEFWQRDKLMLNRLLLPLKIMYSTNPKGPHSVEELIELLQKRAVMGVNPRDMQKAITLLQQLGFVAAHTEIDAEEGRKKITHFTILRTILRHENVEDIFNGGAGNTNSNPTAQSPKSTSQDGPPPVLTIVTKDKSEIARWQVIKPLGAGGQGAVSLVWDAKELPKTLEGIQGAITNLTGLQPPDTKLAAAKQLAEAIDGFSRSKNPTSLGALKKLHNKDSEAYKKALKRMQWELRALKEIDHANIVRLFDENLEDGWFVMEYFPLGTLGSHREGFKGNILKTLRAFRGLVDAVARLHEKNAVHRDIKPENIYVRENDVLVLGDMGLVHFEDAGPRATSTYENVGSRDWMPSWAYGERQDTINKSFDVFGLGKVLWSALSGKSKLLLWYFKNPENDLSKLFPNHPEMEIINELLGQCIVEHETQCLDDAAKLLQHVDAIINRLTRGFGYLDPTAERLCRTCGQGSYQEHQGPPRILGFEEPTGNGGSKIFACSHCGHVELFYFRDKKQLPPAWNRK